jgi:uncharacterized protein YuzE
MIPRTERDPVAGASYTYLLEGNVSRTVAVSESLNVDVGADGRLLGVEVIGDGDWTAALVTLAMRGGSRGPKDPADTQADHYRKFFALQQQAREIGGRHIATGGSGWRGSFYGFVAATCPEGKGPHRHDSWRCHHEHPDDLSAVECALGEVRRLASAGKYGPCSAGPECEDNECRRDWARLNALAPTQVDAAGPRSNVPA